MVILSEGLDQNLQFRKHEVYKYLKLSLDQKENHIFL